MPALNPEQCYKVLPLPSPTEDSMSLTIEQLINEVTTKLASFSEQSVDWIKAELTKFIGASSTYTYKEQIIKGIKFINSYLKKEGVSADEQRVIADKLLEGLGMCTPGFHDRVNVILLGLHRPQHVDDLLACLRHNIVDSVARAFPKEGHDGAGNEVHVHNSFFFAAATLGYGVRPINSDDVYSRELSALESQAIRKAFAEKYHFLPILTELQASIESELRAYFEYKGKKSIAEPYTLGPRTNILNFLNKILGPSLREKDIFIYEDNEEMCCAVETDINWAFIQDCLWKKLKNERYIEFSAEEEALLAALYDYKMPKPEIDGSSAGAGTGTVTPDAVIGLPDLLRQKKYQELFYSLKISHYPQIIKSTAQREEIAAVFIDVVSQGSISDVLEYFKLVNSFFSDDTECKTKYLNLALTPWLEKEENIDACLNVEVDVDNEINITLFSIACARLDPEKLSMTFLVRENIDKLKFALSAAMEGKLKIVNELLDIIKKLAPEAQETIMTAKDSHGWNVLMHVVAHKLEALPALLDAIRTLTPEAQERVVETMSFEGLNVFMGEVISRPATLGAFFEAIRTITPEVQKKIMITKNSRDCNVLMHVVAHKPEVLPVLLEAIKTLDSEAQREIITAKYPDGLNVLMQAARDKPEVLPVLLAGIKTLAPEVQKEILLAKYPDGLNVLMQAARDKPEVLPVLLAGIKTLAPEVQKEILLAKYPDGLNVLMQAARDKPEVLPVLLAGIKTLAPEVQKEILLAKYPNGLNVLMQAARDKPEVLPVLLAGIKTLAPEVQKEILLAKYPDGLNVLMQAARDKPEVLPVLLAGIKTLAPEVQKEILLAKYPDGLNVFMQAVRDKPEALPVLLAGIKTLAPEVQKEIMLAQDKYGLNVLMQAVIFKPDILPVLLAGIKTLAPEVQKEILLAQDKNGLNVLMRAVIFKPEALPVLLAGIKTLAPEVQREIMLAQDKNGLNVLMYSKPAALSILLAGIQILAPEAQREIMLAQDKYGLNVLMQAVISKPDTLPALFEIMRTLAPEVQREIMLAQDKNGLNVLMYSKPAALSILLAGIQILAPEAQREIMLAQDKYGLNVLMQAVISKPDTLPARFEIMRTLAPEVQKEILLAQDKNGLNVLMYSKPAALSILLAGIQTLAPEVQKQVLTAKISNGQSIITGILRTKPGTLDSINKYSMDVQLNILKEPSTILPAVKEYREQLIKKHLTPQDTHTPLEKEIYKQLRLMQFNAEKKQVAVLIALETLKNSETPLDSAIKAALRDNTSPLYTALNTRRYTFFPPLGSLTCGSYMKILKASEDVSPGNIPPTS